jgi:hypothetical protein
MEATCKTCPFWDRLSSTTGCCRRNAPRPAPLPVDREPYAPVMEEMAWCGEHPLRQRDRLAAMAMQGSMAATGIQNWTAQSIAEDAYRIADAMLAARRGGARGRRAARAVPGGTAMTRTEFARTFSGPEGLDAGMAPEEAERFAGPPPEPLGSTVLCHTGTHEIRDGAPCPVCAHGCSSPGDPECKGRE